MCEFCNREVNYTTRHHLIPKKTHSKKKIRRKFSKEQRRETIDVCCDCHKTIHNFISEMVLATNYNTLSLLNHHSHLKRYKKWVQNQREGIV